MERELQVQLLAEPALSTTHRSQSTGPKDVWIGTGDENERQRVTGGRGKSPVLVLIRDALERARPITSGVRLQTLDACYMGATQPPELTPTLHRVSPDHERPRRTFDGELRSLLWPPGVVVASS